MYFGIVGWGGTILWGRREGQIVFVAFFAFLIWKSEEEEKDQSSCFLPFPVPQKQQQQRFSCK
jgi:hypothetical protein